MGITRVLLLAYFATTSTIEASKTSFVKSWPRYVETEELIRQQDMPFVKNYLKMFDLLVDMEESNLQIALTATAAYLQLNDYHRFEDFWTGITLFYIYWSELADEIAVQGHFRFTLFREIILGENAERLDTPNVLGMIYFHLADTLHRLDNKTERATTSESWLKKKAKRDDLVCDRIDSIMSSNSAVHIDVIWPYSIVEFYMLKKWDEEKNILDFYRDLVKFDRIFGRRKDETKKGFFLSPPVPQFFGPRLLIHAIHQTVIQNFQVLTKLINHNDPLDEDLFEIVATECLESFYKMRLYGETLLYIMLYEEMLGRQLLFSELMHPKDHVDGIIHTNCRPVVLVTVQEYEDMEQNLMKSYQVTENLVLISTIESITL